MNIKQLKNRSKMRQKNSVKSRTLKVRSLGVATLLIFTFSFSTLKAQESVNATGGDASGSGGSVSYSVGQVAYQTHTGTSGSVAEGVHQPYEISVITAIEEAKGINLTITAFPNPTADNLTLSINDSEKISHDLSLMSYQLYDMNGKLLRNEKIRSSQTSIVMRDLAPATYYVKVIVEIPGNGSQKEIKTFKVVKTQ